MDQLELSEIQGFLVRDYKDMPFAKYYMLQVSDLDKARIFLKEIAENITTVIERSEDSYFNIGFTSAGLSALGLQPENVRSFIREFREGMVTPHRQRLLGDYDSSDPQHWNWGGPNNEAIHVVLMVFDKTEEAAKNHYTQIAGTQVSNGFKPVLILDSETFPDDKEHFGFRDTSPSR